MLELSAKSSYGVSALFELAQVYGVGCVRVDDIAKKQNIPPDFLRQLLIPLKRAGLVKSDRGILGGYSLAKRPSEITILNILESLEGQIKLNSLKPADKILQNYFSQREKKIKDFFDTTLEELVNEKRKSEENMTYHI